MDAPVRILLILEEPAERGTTRTVVARAVPGAEILEAGSGLAYAQQVGEGPFALAIASAVLSWGDGAQALDKVRQYSPGCAVMLVGDRAGPHAPACGLRRVPLEPDALESAVKALLRGGAVASGEDAPSVRCEVAPAAAVGSPAVAHLALEVAEVGRRAQVLLEDPVLGPHPRALISGFLRAAERLQAVIDHLDGRQRPAVQPPREAVDVSNAVLEAMRGLHDEIRRSQARVLAGVMPSLVVHAGDLVTLFHHLLDNCVKFRGAEPPRVVIRAHPVGASWILSVSDNGRGMLAPAGIDPFEMFARLPEAQGLPGRGVGLAVCRQIARAYGGDIWYESEPGHGVTIHVRLRVNALAARVSELTVSFNMESVGRIAVRNTADKREITRAALALPELNTRLGEETIKDVQLLGDGVVNIVS